MRRSPSRQVIVLPPPDPEQQKINAMLDRATRGSRKLPPPDVTPFGATGDQRRGCRAARDRTQDEAELDRRLSRRGRRRSGQRRRVLRAGIGVRARRQRRGRDPAARAARDRELCGVWGLARAGRSTRGAASGGPKDFATLLAAEANRHPTTRRSHRPCRSIRSIPRRSITSRARRERASSSKGDLSPGSTGSAWCEKNGRNKHGPYYEHIDGCSMGEERLHDDRRVSRRPARRLVGDQRPLPGHGDRRLPPRRRSTGCGPTRAPRR